MSKEIMAGMDFGSWIVIQESERQHGNRMFLCRCQCGNQKKVRMRSLLSDKSTKCRSCSSKETGKCCAKNHAGKTIGKLLAIKPIDGHKPGERIIWEFICSCGKSCCYDGGTVFSSGCSAHVACPDCENSLSCEEKRGLLPIELAYRNTKILTNCGYRKFEISLEEYDKLTTGKPCYYCGESNGRCGLDRVDSSVDYIISNCVPCCIICNRMKNKLDQSVFYNRIELIYNNRVRKL